MKSVGERFRSAIEREHRGKYYNSNSGYTSGGIALSAASLVALFVFGTLEPDTIVLMIIPIVVSVFVSIFVAGLARSFRPGRSLGGKIAAVIAIAIVVFIGLSIISSLVLALFSTLMEFHETPMLFAVGGIVLLNVLYVFIMGAPTPLGAKMMDGIDGLRQYLTLAEKDRMNMAGAPEMSPQHFEKLLPYAVALGVEKPWSRTFETWLAAAAAGDCRCLCAELVFRQFRQRPLLGPHRRLLVVDGLDHRLDHSLAAALQFLLRLLRWRLVRRWRRRRRRRRLVSFPA